MFTKISLESTFHSCNGVQCTVLSVHSASTKGLLVLFVCGFVFCLFVFCLVVVVVFSLSDVSSNVVTHRQW